MKKRQLLIYMLAGSLVFSGMPFTALAQETGAEVSDENVVVLSEEEAPLEVVSLDANAASENTTETPEENTNAPAEEGTPETPAENTDAPTEESTPETPAENADVPAEESTPETPAENTNVDALENTSETPKENPDVFSSSNETTAVVNTSTEGNASVTPSSEPSSEENNTQTTAPFYIGETPYQTLEEAINAVPEATNVTDECTQIKVYSSEWKINATIVIPEKKNICFVAATDEVKISRESNFTGALFQITGGVLNFVTGEILAEDGTTKITSKFVFDGTIVSAENTTENAGESTTTTQTDGCGSLIYVESGILAIGSNVLLQNNNASENGGAIYNTVNGMVYLLGGTISNNTSAKTGGGIYSEGVIYVQGNPVVSENKAGEAAANSNIVLNGEKSMLVVTGVLENTAKLGVLKADTADRQLLFVSENVNLSEVLGLGVITYDDSAFTFDESGKVTEVKSEGDNSDQEDGSDKGDGSDKDDNSNTSRDPILSEISASVVSGLEDAMYFYPSDERSGKYSSYSFYVTGAGTNINEPILGDVKWEPVYWSYSSSPSSSEKYDTWVITTTEENSVVGTHALYVFFEKYEYDGTNWTKTGSTESVKYTYQSRGLFYLTGVSYKWRNQTEVDVTFRTNKAAKYYVEAVVRGTSQPTPVESNFIAMAADTDLTITVSNLEVGTEYDIYVYAIDQDGGISSGVKFQPLESTRPSSETTRDAYTPAVTESVVTGLEKALEFYPNTFYPFTVVGAGTENTDPVEGDIKWMPLYWSTSSNPSSSQKHTTWKIGAAAGISQAATYNMYIFYQKYYYTGSKWEASDTISSVAYQFKSAEIEITITPDQTETSGGYYDEDGNYVSYNGTSGTGSEIGTSSTDTGDTSTATTVATADNTPLGSLLAMLLASMSAVFYVFTRKRKNTDK